MTHDLRLLFTTGGGPAECRIALAAALKAFRDEAEAMALDVSITPSCAGDAHGPASAVAALHGAEAEALAARWAGAILWRSVSPLRPHHKRRNWFIGVMRLAAQAPAPEALDPADTRIDTFRAGGPGGQHQNATDSAVRATHGPTGLSAVARDQRSQHRNRAAAVVRLSPLSITT